MAGVMLDENADEALQRAKHRPVQHHRHYLLARGRDVKSAETARQVQIDLDRAALPIAADRVAQHVFELWSVKGALTLVQRPRPPGFFQRLLERALGLVPYRVVAEALLWPVGEFDPHVVEAEVGIDREQLIVDRERLLRDLLLGDENMGVVLGEGARAQETVERARGVA